MGASHLAFTNPAGRLPPAVTAPLSPLVMAKGSRAPPGLAADDAIAALRQWREAFP